MFSTKVPISELTAANFDFRARIERIFEGNRRQQIAKIDQNKLKINIRKKVDKRIKNYKIIGFKFRISEI